MCFYNLDRNRKHSINPMKTRHSEMDGYHVGHFDIMMIQWISRLKQVSACNLYLAPSQNFTVRMAQLEAKEKFSICPLSEIW